jgi:predicted acylesterase/phospholipase RssA
MGKLLKLGFAMGGGVSLGTFSGAALTEAIKMAVLYGKDKNENPYDKVEIDIFSGASAGSMSLSIMLRALLEQSGQERKNATDKLTNQFGKDFINLEPKKKDALIAAQVAQDLQEIIWVNEINLTKLLGKEPNKPQRNLKYTPSLLDRGAVDDIARKYFDLRKTLSQPKFNFDNRQLLAERVLFASTLTNLTKVQYDSRMEFSDNNDLNYLGLEDGLTSNGHKEMRIFDLNFRNIVDLTELNDPVSYPPRWCRFHVGGEAKGHIGDLKKQRTWSKIIATSIACGCFPFAFEPVVLNRAQYEFGEEIWPQELKDIDKDWYPFTYVDGGTLNNEPIREAFRLASFIDSTDSRDFDRRIVFVDPNVSEPQPQFQVPVHNEYRVEKPNAFRGLDGYDLIRLNSLDRMIPYLSSMLNVVLNESRVIERDKVFNEKNKKKDRTKYRKFIKEAFKNTNPNNTLFNELKVIINKKLDDQKNNLMIPTGALILEGELKRVIIEEKGRNSPLIDRIDDIVNNDNPEADPNANTWIILFFYILIDLLMDFSGKNENADIIAIAPIVEEKGKMKIIDLPGGLLSAFGGFASSYPSIYECKIAKYCTRLFMEKQGMIPPKAGGLGPYPKFKDENIYKQELKSGLRDLSTRLQQMIKSSHLLNILPGIDNSILFLLNNFVEKAINKMNLDDDPIVRFTFKVEVPSRKFEFDGKKMNSDFKPIEIDGKYYLITQLKYHLSKDWQDDQRWEGIHIIKDKQQLDIDKGRILVDRNFCTIKLPDKNMVNEALIMPNPIFETTISKSNENEVLSKNKWKVGFGVTSLEDTLIPDS